MAKKTNKTSHVLNLITGSQPPPGPAKETEQTGSPVSEPVSVPSGKVTVVDAREEEKLAEEIQKNLLKELEKEQAQETSSARKDEQPGKETEEQPEAEAEEAVQQSGSAAEETAEQPQYRVVNIMEELLTSEVILDMLKSNDTCTCNRCQADVKALMLTRLQPKYIVADVTAVPMLLTYYRNKFRVAILSQSIRACMEVKEHPRHNIL